MNKTAFFILFSLVSSFTFASEQMEFDVKDLNAVAVSVLTGKVNLEAGEGPTATVNVTKNKFSEHCKLTIEKKDHKLQIKVEKSPRFFSLEDCDANFDIKVPKKTDMNLNLGSGVLNIKGLQGELIFNLGSGEMKADGSFPKLDGKTGSGPVHVAGLTGGGTVKTGSGSVDLVFSGKPERGTIEVQAGSGDTTMTFPKGSKVKTTFVAGMGKLHNELGDSAEGSFLVSVKAGAGNLSIKAH